MDGTAQPFLPSASAIALPKAAHPRGGKRRDGRHVPAAGTGPKCEAVISP